MAAPVEPYWRTNWSEHAFSPTAAGAMVKVDHVVYNRTFVRVEMLSKHMIKVWIDLLKHNHPRSITAAQHSILIAGPCKLYMCFLTSNHMDVTDPVSISCIVPMYVNKANICFQGLMELNKTLTGSLIPFEQLILLIISARFAPRTVQFEHIFISPLPNFGKLLRHAMEAHGVTFNRCVAGTLQTVHPIHARKKCDCSLMTADWKETGIFCYKDSFIFKLPSISFKGQDMGVINVPWATGRSFDLIKQQLWLEDEGVAALTQVWYEQTKPLQTAESTSFLSILMGIDGIHIIDFAKFITLDPAGLPQLLEPSDPASVTGPLPPSQGAAL
jgi:hypothetical protein